MRYQILQVACLLLLVAMLGACKKADEPAATNPPADHPNPAPRANPSAAVKAPDRAEEGVLLKVKWPVGNRYTYRMDLDQQNTNHFPQMPQAMKQTVNMAMTYAITALSESPAGGHELEVEFLATEMEVKMGDQTMVSFDSKEKDKSDAQNPFSEPFQKMIGSKVHLQVDAAGRVEKVLNLEEWRASVMGDPQGPAAGMIGQQFNEGYFHQIAEFGRGFPDKPVHGGESWPYRFELPAGPMGKISVDSKVTFKDWEDRQQHKCAALETAGEFTGSISNAGGPVGKMEIEGGKASGRSWFDPEVGTLVESVSDQTMRMKAEMGGPPGGNQGAMSLTIELGQKVTVNLVNVAKRAP